MNSKFIAPQKEYNRLESKIQILENVIFTNIIQYELAKQPLSAMVDSYLLVSIQQNIPIRFSIVGMVANNKDFQKATQLIENSVLYN